MVNATEQRCRAMRDVIAFAAAGAHQIKVNKVPVDWETFFRLAHEHHVVPLVGCALLNSPELNCPEQYREYALNVMRTASSGNLVRKQRVLHFLGELKAVGINAQVLKGYAAARYYAYPECRDAGDTDLLIEPCDEKRVNEFLQGKGFQILERSASSHHAIAAHPKYGKLEMHVSLHNEIVEEIWFQDINKLDIIQESPILIEDAEGSYETLGNTDHLLFITLHMIKHFIGSGLTVRMLLDVALYFAHNSATIDHQRFWNVIDRLQYSRIVNGVFSLLIRAECFEEKDFPGMQLEPTIVDLLVKDMVLGGYMGVNETSDRHTAAMIYNRKLALRGKSEARYRIYMILWKLKSATTHWFPSKQLLERMYPIAARYPSLNPIFRLYQFVAFPVKKLRSGIIKQEIRTNDSAVETVANRRIDLFKQLGML